MESTYILVKMTYRNKLNRSTLKIEAVGYSDAKKEQVLNLLESLTETELNYRLPQFDHTFYDAQ